MAEESSALRFRGPVLPDGESRDLYVVDGRVTYEPVASAELVGTGLLVAVVVLAVLVQRGRALDDRREAIARAAQQSALNLTSIDNEDYDEDVRAIARETGCEHRVFMPGYVDDAGLEWLWRRAGVAAFPTRAEGFGLPLLEAMARGVPVAAHDIPVLREVGVGQSAATQPLRVSSWSIALRTFCWSMCDVSFPVMLFIVNH